MANTKGRQQDSEYQTVGGIRVSRSERDVCASVERAELLSALDTRRGMLLASSYEYPGRYKRYDYGFVDPPLVVEAGVLPGRLHVRALTRRGALLLSPCLAAWQRCAALDDVQLTSGAIQARVREPDQSFAEEARTRAPSALSAVRALLSLFSSPEDNLLGLYGALGHDLVFQFETLEPRLSRADDQRDLVLYLPDRLLVIDHQRGRAQIVEYDFETAGQSTRGLPREPVTSGADSHCRGRAGVQPRDHAPGEFSQLVTQARQAFARGDLFEVTPSQRFQQPCAAAPSALFTTLQRENPAPYGFVANLGRGEHLIGASPEMYVRVSDRRIETCPIAGTVARGSDALGDAAQIFKLLSSSKDEAELTMCTDVDRNDKARICEPGSVRVIGRRQIELYSRLIHTVDHVEGRLRAEFDALDGFLSHMWAVTVTGAPKQGALQFIEDHERSPRGFYGGAIGALRFDGSMDTGLVLRTIALKAGVASVRVGATLHFDSDPRAEEQETELKASALLAALQSAAEPPSGRVVNAPAPAETAPSTVAGAAAPGLRALRVLVIDHRDSFVHTLGDYLRQAGCAVTTLRFDRVGAAQLRAAKPELVVLSPGPCRPDDFGMRATLRLLEDEGMPVFGVCLGLQGMVEYCGGQLRQLDTPMHGKASEVQCAGGSSPLFHGLPRRLKVGRYHSLYTCVSDLPEQLEALAVADTDRCCMALAHRTLPWTAVQFHPESILSADRAHGLQLIRNVVADARRQQRQASQALALV